MKIFQTLKSLCAKSPDNGQANNERLTTMRICDIKGNPLESSEEAWSQGPRLKVVGVGGAGCRAVNHCIQRNLHGIVEYVAMDTDADTLAQSLAPVKVLIPSQELADAESKISIETAHEIHNAIGEADLVFIMSGMGGVTGSAVSPSVGKIAMEKKALTMSVAFNPITIGGKRLQNNIIAEEALERLLPHVDSLIVVHGNNVATLARQNDIDPCYLFSFGDEIMLRAVKSVSVGIAVTGLIGLDYADMHSVFSHAGTALIGVGHGSGASRARDAAQQALESPLLGGREIDEAVDLYIDVAASPDSLTMEEIGEAAGFIQGKANEDSRVLFGTSFDKSLGGELQVTVLAAIPHALTTRNRQRYP